MKRILTLLIFEMSVFQMVAQHHDHGKNGNEINVGETWEEDGMIKCTRFNSVVSYPKSMVLKVERDDSGKSSNEPNAVEKEATNKYAGVTDYREKLLLKLYLDIRKYRKQNAFHAYGFSRSPYKNWLNQCKQLWADIFWLKDESLEDSENLPAPDVLAMEIVEHLGVALSEFQGIVDELNGDGGQ